MKPLLSTDTTDRRIDVFFYGLFMDEALLRNQGLDPRNLRRARLDDFKLVIGPRATLMPFTGQVVHGVLFSLTHDEIRKLYDEPSVAAYRPEPVLAQLEDGQNIPALCFNLPVESPGERNAEYAAKLKELAIRLKLPSSYTQTI